MIQGERVDTRVSWCQSRLLPAFLNYVYIISDTEVNSCSLLSHLHLLDLNGHHLGVGGGVPCLDPHVVTPGDDDTGLINQHRAWERGNDKNCQALVPNPSPPPPQSPQTQSQTSPTQLKTQINPKGTGAETKIL